MEEAQGQEVLASMRSLCMRMERTLEEIRKSAVADGSRSAFSFYAEEDATRGSNEVVANGRERLAKPPLPDPRLVRLIIRHRQLRGRFFDADLFADPAWDMLLDLTAARAEKKRVHVTSLCIASGVPPTTALRWINLLVNAGLLERTEDDQDHRRSFIALSDKGAAQMAEYFRVLGQNDRFLM